MADDRMEEMGEEEEFEVITLTDDEGVAEEFALLDTIEYEGKVYVVLASLEDEENEDGSEDVLILRVEEDEDGNETFSGEPDNDIVQAVFDIFQTDCDDDDYEFGDAE